MANIEQLRGQLEGVGDNDLVRYAQNPPANMPQYLVLAELQKRKSLREEKQEPPPQSTVKQDLIQGGLGDLQQQMPMQQPMPAGEGAPPQEAPAQEAAPEETVTAAEGGIMSLPIREDMFEEESMAAGGIIAFEDGGEVPRYDGRSGSLIGNPDYKGAGPTSDPLFGMDTDRYVIEGYRLAYPRIAEKFKKDPNSLTAGELNVIKVLQERGEVPMFSGAPAANPFEVKKYMATAPDNIPTPARPSVAQSSPAAPPAGPPGATPPPAPRASQVPGMPSVGNLTNPYTKSVMDRLAELNKPVALPADFKPAGMTPQEAARGVQDMQKLFGVSEAGYDKYGKVLEQRMADLQSQKDKSGWLALARAGFETAAGTSPYALSNIGRGAIKGLEEYSMAQDKLLAAQDRLDLAQFNLSDAQNRFRMEGSREAARTLEERRRDVESARREAIKYNVSAENESRKANKSDIIKQVDASLAVQKENIDIALKKAGLELQRFSADTQRMMLDKPDLVNTTLGFLQQDPEFQKASGSEKARRFAEAISGTKAAGTSTYQAEVLRQKGKILERLEMNPQYRKAREKNDVASMNRMFDEEAKRIIGTSMIPGGASGALDTQSGWGELSVR